MLLELKGVSMKNNNFPSPEEIKKILKELEEVKGSRMLHGNASTVDKIKFELRKSFIIYKQDNKLNQKELADILEIDPPQMSKILRYHIEDNGIDRHLSTRAE
jgi:predicted XRE-type DNA-binding protein